MMHQDVRNLESNLHHAAVLKLMGVGGGGCNAIEHMVAADIHGLQFTCINTDAQALARYNPEDVIQLGTSLTRGLGAGADPEMGRLAAEEDKDRIAEAIGDADLLFLTAGMGGGTGTGAIPVVARIARELGVLTVAVVTKPFLFEGDKRRGVANAGIEELRRQVDSLIVVPNENLLSYLGPNTPLIDAFAASNDILTNAVQSIAELITTTGLINVDFADVKSVMTEMGQAMMSTGRGIGEYRARDAAIAAIESPLLDNIDLKDARGILANVTASSDLSMGEFHIVGDIISNITAEDANVVIGTVFDQRMKDEMRVTVVATGLNSRQAVVPDVKPAEKSRIRKGLFGAKTGVVKPAKYKSASVRTEYGKSDAFKSASQGVTSGRLAGRKSASDRKQGASQKTGNPSSDISATTESAGPLKLVEPPQKKEICYLCDGPLSAHSMQCPLREQPAKDSRPKTERRARPASRAYAAGEINAPAQSKKMSTGQKLNMAGLLAGVLVLVSIFYTIVSNKVADGYSQIVSNDLDNSTLATQKDQPADRRLSRIDD